MNVTKTENKRRLSGFAKGGIIGGAAAIVVAAAIILLMIMMGSSAVAEERIERIIDYGTITQGVSINGIDISGMTDEQALEATAGIEEDMLDDVMFELDVDGDVYAMNADDLQLFTDYEDVAAAAIAFGRTGSFDERMQQRKEAQAGKDFSVRVQADNSAVVSVIAQFKADVDVVASGAGFEFMPWGYFEETGEKYEPNLNEMATQTSKKNLYEHPEGLVRIAPEDMPAQIRYQYYRATYFYRDKNDGEVYMPVNSDIARFKYTEESKGISIDTAGTVELIIAAVQSGAFGRIEVPAEITHTDTSVEQAKHDTQLLVSWTSYLNHNPTGRMYNVAKLSGIICGVEIQPGETWSINEEAGPRTLSTGWKNASGYTYGIPVDQPGGGVCQISSTLYNAALRAGLDYSEDIVSKRHSTVSDYIPIGLDATISTPSPDLKFKNPFDYSLYIVSYMNGDDKCVTVEIYGRPLTNEDGKEIILGFSSKTSYKGEAPGAVIVYDTAVTPAPTNLEVPVGGYVEVGYDQALKKANVYVTVYDLEGNVLVEKEVYYQATYPSKTKYIYCNFPQPTDPLNPLVPDPPEDPEGGEGGEGEGTGEGTGDGEGTGGDGDTGDGEGGETGGE